MQNAEAEDRYLVQAMKFERDLRQFLRRFVPSESDVPDLLQETYAKLLRAGAPGKRPVLNVRYFAFECARNVARDRFRHEKVIPIDPVSAIEELDVQDQHVCVEESVNAEQELEQLLLAVNSLSERHRQVFTLQRIFGMTLKEVGRRLRLSPNTVEKYSAEALAELSTAVLSQAGPSQRSSLFERIQRRVSGQ